MARTRVNWLIVAAVTLARPGVNDGSTVDLGLRLGAHDMRGAVAPHYVVDALHAEAGRADHARNKR